MKDVITAQLTNQSWLHSKPVRHVIEALLNAGGEARFVGGAVRDSLLKLPVRDIDIATSLLPQDVMQIMETAHIKVFPTGIRHGTVTAYCAGATFEITTLRHDVETDGRHANVAFTNDWQADAARRDFTMNALYADLAGHVYDYFGGVEDAEAGRVRFIGIPQDRIREDALRIMRFFRFHATHGRGAPDSDALKACIEMSAALANLSRERIRDELLKLLGAGDPVSIVSVMLSHQLLADIVPGKGDVDTLRRVVGLEARVQQNVPLRRFMALSPKDSTLMQRALQRLRFSNKDIKRGLAMIEGCPVLHVEMSDGEARAQLYTVGAETFIDRLVLNAGKDAELTRFLHMAHLWRRPQLPVNGGDLLASGVANGPDIGRVLKSLEAIWVSSDFKLGRTELLERLKAL